MSSARRSPSALRMTFISTATIIVGGLGLFACGSTGNTVTLTTTPEGAGAAPTDEEYATLNAWTAMPIEAAPNQDGDPGVSFTNSETGAYATLRCEDGVVKGTITVNEDKQNITSEISNVCNRNYLSLGSLVQNPEVVFGLNDLATNLDK